MASTPRLADFQKVLPDTLLLLDADGTILDNHVPDRLGLFAPVEPLNGRHFSSAMPAGLANSLEESINLARTSPAPVSFEIGTTCNGRNRAFEVRVMSREDHACLAIFRDITLRQRSDDMLHQIASLRLELAHAERAILVGRMTAALMHEIGQPITAILANADAALRLLVRHSPDIYEIRQINADIIASAESATDMFDRLRDILNQRRSDIEVIDLNQLVEDIALMCRDELMQRQIMMETILASRLPAISGARAELQQMILNLLLNAADGAKSGDRPAIVITTSQVGSSAAIDVHDNGRRNGTGMGLVIGTEVVRRHGGTIEILHEGTGTTMRVLLPLAGSAQSSSAHRPPAALASESLLQYALADASAENPETSPQTSDSAVTLGALDAAIARSRQLRVESIRINLQAAINNLRLARNMRDPDLSRRSLRNAFVTLDVTGRLMRKLPASDIHLRELASLRLQVLDLVAEQE